MSRSGPAIIEWAERTYVTPLAEYDGRAVSFTGRLRVRDLHGERLYEPRSYTVSIDRVVVEWITEPEAAAA